MNIALVIFRAEIERGGAERYVRDLSVALTEHGHRVSVLASTGQTAPGVEFVRIGAHGVSRTVRYRRFCRNLERHLDEHRYDIVHACLPVPRCDVYHTHSGLESISLRDGHLKEPTLARQAASKLFASINRKRRAFADVEAKLINSTQPPIVLCLSNRERDAAISMFPAARDRFQTLYSIPDDNKFSVTDVLSLRQEMRRQLGLDDAQTMFLFVGNDFERKGLATAIRAIGRMSDPRSMLYVVGKGDTRKYTEIALKAGAVGRVMFAGRSSNVRNFFAAADATVLPTRSEPFGMVVVESILMGVPPIVSRIAGASEVLSNGLDGFVIDDPSDVPAWAAAMNQLTVRDFRDTLAQACLGQRDRFSYARHVAALEAIYRDCKTRNIR